MSDPNAPSTPLDGGSSTTSTYVPPVILSKLAPREHVKALYRDTSLLMPRDRTIAVKSDLIKAVNNSPVPIPPGAARAALAGGPNKPEQPSSSSGNAGSISGSKAGNISIISSNTGPNLIDKAIENTARAMQDLETAVNVHAEKYNRMKNAAEEKQRKVIALKNELYALRAADTTITQLETKTQLLTAGHPLGHDPLTSPVSIYESVPGLVKFDPDDNSDVDDLFGNDSEEMSSDEGDSQTYRSSALRDQQYGQSIGGGSSTLGPSASRMLNPNGSVGKSPGSKQGGGTQSVISGQIEMDRMEKIRKLIKHTRRRIARADYRKRQFEYMMERYRSNAEVLDRHMKGVEEATHAAKRELNEVNAYQRVLAASKEAVAVELHRTQLAATAEKIHRAKKLEELQTELNKATQMEIWRKQREAVRSEMAAELAGDLSKEQEDMLLKTLTDKQVAFQRLQLERRQREERAASLQEAFNKIKTATGITTLNEMAEKFLSQPTQRAQLAKEKADAETKLNNAKDAYEKAQKEYNDLRASGASSVAAAVAVSAVIHNNPGNDEFELQQSSSLYSNSSSAQIKQKIETTKQEIKSLTTICDRISHTINSVHQGVEGIEDILGNFRSLLVSSQRAIAHNASEGGEHSNSHHHHHDHESKDEHSVASATTALSHRVGAIMRDKNTRISSALPMSSRMISEHAQTNITTATDPVVIGKDTYEMLYNSEVTGTVLIQLLARAVQAYLTWSLHSRDTNTTTHATNTTTDTGLLSIPSLTNYNGNIISPTTIPIPKKSYTLHTDQELLQYLNTLLAYPYINGNANMDTPLLTPEQLTLLRNFDITVPLTPGVASQILQIVNTVSIRMLSVAGNAPGIAVPSSVSSRTSAGSGVLANHPHHNNGTTEHHPSHAHDPNNVTLPVISEQQGDDANPLSNTHESTTLTTTAAPHVIPPPPLMTIESTIAMLGDVHWNPRKNMDPILHGNNVRVTPFQNNQINDNPSPTKGNKKKKGTKKDEDEEEKTPTPAVHEISSYYKRQQALFEAAGLSSIGGYEPEQSEDDELHNPEANISTVYDPLTSGLRTGITSTQRFMEAAKRHRHEMEERAAARAQYTSVIKGDTSLLSIPNLDDHGSDSDEDNSDDEDTSNDQDNSNYKNDKVNANNKGNNKNGTGKDKKGNTKTTNGMDNDKKKVPISIASIIAQDVDPDGLLDRKLIKRLAKEMDTVEIKRKEAESHAATATGRIALQKALQRRTSLARLMTGIATNPIATFANSGRGELQPTPATTNVGNTKLIDVSSTETMKNDSMLGNNGSVVQLLSGLAIYTTRPKLR